MKPSDPASVAPGDGGDQHARVKEAAAARGLEIEIRERPAAGSLFEAAELLGISRKTLWEKMKRGMIEAPQQRANQT